MLIGELSLRTGLSRDTIRFYEKKGLIEIPRKLRRENNYKEYPDAVLNKLLLIIQVKELGFTLNEIDSFFESWRADDASCNTLVHVIEQKLTKVQETIANLNEMKARLESSLVKCHGNDCQFEKTIPSCICK